MFYSVSVWIWTFRAYSLLSVIKYESNYYKVVKVWLEKTRQALTSPLSRAAIADSISSTARALSSQDGLPFVGWRRGASAKHCTATARGNSTYGMLRTVHQLSPDWLRQAPSSRTTILLRILEDQCRPIVRYVLLNAKLKQRFQKRGEILHNRSQLLFQHFCTVWWPFACISFANTVF